MAIGMTDQELDKYRFPHFPFIHALKRLYPVRLKARTALLRLAQRTSEIPKLVVSVGSNFEQASDQFHKNGWVFIESFFPADVYEQLVRAWPPFYHFKPLRNVYKSYNSGFIRPEFTKKKFPELEILENYLHSDSFAYRLKEFLRDDRSRRMSPLHFTSAHYQSSCINHLDSAAKPGTRSVDTERKNSLEEEKPEVDSSINMIVFLKGTGGSRSGGTCIYKDANGGVEFETTNLVNSCLIYRSERLFHGFPPMRLGAYRWMFTCGSRVDKRSTRNRS